MCKTKHAHAHGCDRAHRGRGRIGMRIHNFVVAAAAVNTNTLHLFSETLCHATRRVPLVIFKHSICTMIFKPIVYG